MGLWQGAWRLAWFELRTGKGGMVATAIFFIYMAVVGSALMDDLFASEISPSYRWVPDFIYLGILPNMGFLMNRALFRVWQDDSYSRKLAMWRTMPIRLDHIAAGRLMSCVIVAIPMWLLFFGLQYGLSDSARNALDLTAFFNFSLFWLAYAITSGVLYIYCELGFTGKVYFAICLSAILIYAALIFAIWLTEKSAIERIIEAAESNNWLPTIGAWVVAILAVTIGRSAIARRIQSRDLLQ